MALFCEARYRERWPFCIVLLLIGFGLGKLARIGLVYLEYADRVPWNFSCHEHFMLRELGSILIPSLLFKDIRLNFNELLVRSRPCLRSVVGRWEQYLKESIESLNRRVMDNYKE